MRHSYNISAAEKFDAEDYPKVASELAAFNEGIAHTSNDYKGDIVISYLKDHCLKQEWIAANPNLTKLVTSNQFSTSHIESLFESCRTNKSFLLDFEAYVKKNI